MINAEQIVMDAGYGIVNFTYLYCLGYYLRHYYMDKRTGTFYFEIYLASCLGTFVVNAAMSRIMGFYFNSMISYNTVFTLVGAVGLFMCFKHLKIEENQGVTWLAKHSFAVYLIHMRPALSAFTFKMLLGVNCVNGLKLTVTIIFLPLAIYIVCTLIDTAVSVMLSPFQRALISKISNMTWSLKEKKDCG